MVIPQPLPDEVCLGHIGRIKRLNSCKSSVIEAIPVQLLKIDRRDYKRNMLSIIGDLCGMGAVEYTRLHSFIPFFISRAKKLSYPEMQDWKMRQMRLKGTDMPTERASFCQRCVEEDLRFRGYSYWRRSHQIPGLLWCQKHGCLLHVAKHLRAFDSTPANCLPNAKRNIETCGVSFSDAPADIKQYLEICSLLLESHIDLDATEVSAFLKHHAFLLGILTSPNKSQASKKAGRSKNNEFRRDARFINNQREKRPFLSDVILRRFPSDWLAEAFPSMRNKQIGMFKSPIDNVFRISNTSLDGQSIAIALVSLFDCSEVGFRKLITHDLSMRIDENVSYNSFPTYVRHQSNSYINTSAT